MCKPVYFGLGGGVGIVDSKKKTVSSEGKLNMESSRLGSYIGGKRGFALFFFIWHVSWITDWSEIYEASLFYCYLSFVDFIHPYSLGLNLENILFKNYAVVYFYIIAGLAPLVMGFCIFSSYLHFRIAYNEGFRVRYLVMVSNLFLFSAIIVGLIYLVYFNVEGIPIPNFAAESKYYYTGFCLMLLWGFGFSVFVIFYIIFSLFFKLKDKF